MTASELHQELKRTLIAINVQIDYVRKDAEKEKISAYSLRDMNGNFLLSPLLVAKANVLNGLMTLKGT